MTPVRQILADHLRLAEKHVADGVRHLERQRALVAQLERDGHNTVDACNLLKQFEEMQAMHIADRNRLVSELAERGDD